MPDKKSFTAEWFRKAKEDLDSAKILLDASPSHPETACFLIHQGIEKSLKGYLSSAGVKFKKTHDLALLSNLVIDKRPDLRELLRASVELQHFAVQIRYPGEDDPPTLVESEKHLDLANRIFGFLSQT